MPEFCPEAWYVPADIVRAKQAPKDSVVKLRDRDGVVRDEITAMKDEWVVMRGMEGWTEFPDVFDGRYLPMSGEEHSYVVIARPVRLAQPLDGDEARTFLASWVRSNASGKPFCRVAASLGFQAAQLGSAPEDAAAREHLGVLRVLRTALGAKPTFDPKIQGDLHMFDIMSALFGERAPEEHREFAGGNLMPADIQDVTAEAAARDDVFGPPWIALGSLPFNQMDQMRLLQEIVFGDLTETPLADIQMTFFPHTPDDNPMTDFIAWLARGEPRPLARQPDFSNIAPGYEVKLDRFAREGIEYLVAEDLMGQYVYAWPDGAPVPLPGRTRP